MKKIFLLTFFFCLKAHTRQDYVIDRQLLTNNKGTFCEHKFLPFPCYGNQYANDGFSIDFFSLIGEGFAIQIISSEENFISADRGIFSTGHSIANPLVRTDLLSLGNYYQKGPDWVKQGKLLVWRNGVKTYEENLEFQVNGQDSRSSPQKAIRLKLSAPLPLSSHAPRVGLQRLTIYPLYKNLGGTKILHHLINEMFRKKEIWFEEWQVVPVLINDEFWGIYLLARPDLEIQEDHFQSTAGFEADEFKEDMMVKNQYVFDPEALMKFIAFQSVIGNEDIQKNFRMFIDEDKINFTYTDLDETFNTGISSADIAEKMGLKEIKGLTNSERLGEHEKYWQHLASQVDVGKQYELFVQKHFLYLLFNDFRWGRPFRSGEDHHIREKLRNYVERSIR